MNQTVIGWTSCYEGVCPVVPFTDDKKKALIERIRKREYEFNHTDHCFLSYCAPVYADGTTCELTKKQFDAVMNEAYKDMPRGQRFLPQDAIEDVPVNGILFEKQKFKEEWSDSNGG